MARIPGIESHQPLLTGIVGLVPAIDFKSVEVSVTTYLDGSRIHHQSYDRICNI